MPSCELSGRSSQYTLSPAVVCALNESGSADDQTLLDMHLGWHRRTHARVLGVEFVAGEPLCGIRRSGWSNYRCGSVITVLVGGCSRYALVKDFIERVDGLGDAFAVVEWLSVPSYPYHPNPVVVRLRDDDMCPVLPCLVSIFDIDPCGVCLSRCEGESCWYVYRTRGIDTVGDF